MGKFLTGKIKMEQTEKNRIWRLLENTLYLDDNEELILVPRNMETDGYTIPLLVDFLVGSGFDADLRCSSAHDIGCYCHAVPVVTLSINDLIEKGFLYHDNDRNCWICRDIPSEYLKVKRMSKLKVNNLLYRCMKAAKVPKVKRIKIRIGVMFNIGWYFDLLTKKVFELDLNNMYSRDYWSTKVHGK